MWCMSRWSSTGASLRAWLHRQNVSSLGVFSALCSGKNFPLFPLCDRRGYRRSTCSNRCPPCAQTQYLRRTVGVCHLLTHRRCFFDLRLSDARLREKATHTPAHILSKIGTPSASGLSIRMNKDARFKFRLPRKTAQRFVI